MKAATPFFATASSKSGSGITKTARSGGARLARLDCSVPNSSVAESGARSTPLVSPASGRRRRVPATPAVIIANHYRFPSPTGRRCSTYTSCDDRTIATAPAARVGGADEGRGIYQRRYETRPSPQPLSRRERGLKQLAEKVRKPQTPTPFLFYQSVFKPRAEEQVTGSRLEPADRRIPLNIIEDRHFIDRPLKPATGK